MATDTQRLIVSLEATTKKFEAALNKANGVANRSARRIESRFSKMNSRIGSGIAGAVRRWGFALAAGLSVRALKNLSDESIRINNALRLANHSGEELDRVFQRLKKSATDNFAPLETLTKLYQRGVQAQTNLNTSSEELLEFSDKIAVALRVSGKSAEASRGALIQLSQSLGQTIVRAEEFNAVQEGALPILQAISKGLEEAGGSVSKLRNLVIKGKVSGEAYYKAFLAGSVILEEKVATAQITVDQALGNLHTSLVDIVRDFNKSTNAGQNFADGINSIAKALDGVDVSSFIERIGDARRTFRDFLNDIGNASIFANFNKRSGATDEEGNPFSKEFIEAREKVESLENEVKILHDLTERNIAFGFDNRIALQKLAAVRGQLAAARAEMADISSSNKFMFGAPSSTRFRAGTPEDPNAIARGTPAPVKVKTVSISDFPSGGDDDDKKSKPFERKSRQTRERTAVLQAETAAQAGINPLVDDYGFALERAAAKQELVNAAKRQGLEVTPALSKKIDELADGYASASVRAAMLEESQDRVRESAEDLGALGKDVLGGFISDIRAGTNAADALANSLNKIADKLIDITLDNLFSTKPGGNFLSALFGGGGGGDPWAGLRVPTYATGTMNHPGGMAVVGEKGPELLNLPRGAQVFPRIPAGAGGSDKGTVVNVINQASGTETEQRKRSSGGTEIIDVLVKRVGQNYGLRRQPTRT